MGRVFAAYDPRLDRRVAIKVLLARARSEQWRTQAHARLLREAQAMARLSHPNIVTVYEVGELGADLFIAMEYVKGATVRGWLEAEPRDWRDVIEVFLQAGRGLAAAHAAGLVHRDVKPDNILVGDDGIVRVTDFGLVGATGGSEARDGGALTGELTETGTIVGTPRYMAPEQHRGAAVDARTDQFAFGVALYEALYRQRPFAGDTAAELSKA
ncbi:MAG: serine/threonine protein kinase, partial [Deltaproteobacteria bacterium]|nr:serine/threonine protein kinase [Kofleriaceae bacterium]